ncbi:MAG: hypothetical protein K0S18_123 [Anaerocolumna sp.]|nr:hypothetical protein [Anaerocolumna sp.]
MGGSTTRFSKCYCSKCRDKYYKAYLITHRRTIDWNNVSAVAKNGEYITLHCKITVVMNGSPIVNQHIEYSNRTRY